MWELGILPPALNGYDFLAMMKSLPPEERRRRKRKFRKIWRSLNRNMWLKTENGGRPSETTKRRRKVAVFRHIGLLIEGKVTPGTGQFLR